MRYLAFAIGLAACGPTVHQAPAPEGCPPADLVALTSWNPRATAAPPYQGTPREAAWLVRLGFRSEDAVDAPRPGPLPAYEVAKLGLGPLPEKVWLLRPALAPCPAKVTGYVVERIDDGADVSLRISAMLTGCPAPADGDEWPRAWISFAAGEPTGCEVHLPAPVGARTGAETSDTFTVPAATPESALPEVWAAFAPDACEGCETLWSESAIAGEPAVSVVTITQIAPGHTGACDVEHTDSYGIYATPTGGTPAKLALADDVDLDATLADKRGTRVILTSGVDTWAAHDLSTDGTLGTGRVVRHFIAHPEDNLWHSLAPYCGP